MKLKVTYLIPEFCPEHSASIYKSEEEVIDANQWDHEQNFIVFLKNDEFVKAISKDLVETIEAVEGE